VLNQVDFISRSLLKFTLSNVSWIDLWFRCKARPLRYLALLGPARDSQVKKVSRQCAAVKLHFLAPQNAIAFCMTADSRLAI
jgi:hypothetical protein